MAYVRRPLLFYLLSPLTSAPTTLCVCCACVCVRVCVCCRYEVESNAAANADHVSLEGCQLATQATRDIACGDEILVSYGAGHWLTHVGFAQDGDGGFGAGAVPSAEASTLAPTLATRDATRDAIEEAPPTMESICYPPSHVPSAMQKSKESWAEGMKKRRSVKKKKGL